MPRRTCALTMILLALLIAATTDAGACYVQRAFVSSHGTTLTSMTVCLQ